MSEATPKVGSPTPSSRDRRESVEQANVREYTALRARRAARVSLEVAAARRRLVTAGLGTALTVLIAVLAIVGSVSWLWMIAPAAFLIGSVVTSVVAADRAKKASMLEDARLAQLRPLVRGDHTWGSGSWKDAKAQAKVAWQEAAEVSVTTVEETSSPSSQVSGSRIASTAAVAASNGTSDVSVVADEIALSADDPQVAAFSEEALSRVSGGEWDYVPMPEALHSRRASVQNRAVHPHTDIRGVRKVERAAAVPGRPMRATLRTATIEELEISSNPTFRFDLDAVLDQRRAQ